LQTGIAICPWEDCLAGLRAVVSPARWTQIAQRTARHAAGLEREE
jgi:hypothetical protein